MVENKLWGGYVNVTGTGFDNEIRIEVQTDKGYQYIQVDEDKFYEMLKKNLNATVVWDTESNWSGQHG
ncbi:putative transcriptional regulator [Bacillus phage vB_BcgM]|nr:putative transcriptional regulator [Bacillus phage vB_BcgM]